MKAAARAAHAALVLLPLLAMSAAAASEQAPPPATNATRWRPPAVAERRGWVPLNMPCPTCRHAAVTADSSPQGAAAVGRALPPPPQFAQQHAPLPQQQQTFLQPFQQQLLLNQQQSFAQPPPPPSPPPSAAADSSLYLLRPQSSPPTAVAAAFGPSSLPQQNLQQVPQRAVKTTPQESQQTPREEVQLLYVPVEALRQRNRGPPPQVQQRIPSQQLQPQLQSPQIPSHLLFQTQSAAPPLLAPRPTATTTTSTTTTTLATTTTLEPLLRHRFRGGQVERSRYLEQSLPRPSPSTAVPVLSPTASSPITTPAPHQPPLSIFVGRHPSTGNPRIGDVIAALRGSRSIAVMDEPGSDAPDVFVGPANLASPPGYFKFELPYLSTIMAESRGERRVDRLPFFVAPLSFRPPPGYSKIPFPAPHVGSVVVANSTTPTPQQTNTPVSSTVALPADLPPISAELPALVNSLQDARTTGDVLLLPAGRDSAAHGKRVTHKPQQAVSQVYQQQTQVKQPLRHQTPVQYLQTTKIPDYTQQQYVPQQEDDYQTQPPVTSLYSHNPELSVQQEHTTHVPLNTYSQQQNQDDQYQQDYLQPVHQQPIHQQPVHQQPVHQQSVRQQPLHQQHVHQQPVQQQPVQQQTLAQRHPTPLHEENYPVTEQALDAVGHELEQEQALHTGLQTLHAGLALQHETGVPETTPAVTTTTSAAPPPPRRQHFRGRQRASSSFASVTPSPSVAAAPEPTRRPVVARTRRPTHHSRARGEDGSSDAVAQRGQHRFRGRTRPATTTTTTTQFSTSTDPTTPANHPPAETTPAYQQNAYDPVGETTPSYQQLDYNGGDENSPVYSQPAYNAGVDTTPTYQQPLYRPAPETTPAYQQRPLYSNVERVPAHEQPLYSAVERVPERKRPSYSATDRAPEHQRPSYSSAERAPHHQRPTYDGAERAPEPQLPAYSAAEGANEHSQQPTYAPERGSDAQVYGHAPFQPAEANPNVQGAYAAGGESDPDLRVRATPPYTQHQAFPAHGPLSEGAAVPVDPTAAQYLDGGSYRQLGDSPPYDATSERSPSATHAAAPDGPAPHDLPAVDSTTPTAEDASSMQPPAGTNTFQRTRGRKTHVRYHSASSANGNGVGGGEQPGAAPRPVQVRVRGRVRNSRPRPPPEPENYPPNFPDGAVFDATRRPGSDYSYETAPPSGSTEAAARPLPSSTESAVRAPARGRGIFVARGTPRRPGTTPALDDAAASSTEASATSPLPDRVYTVRPARRPQAPARVTSVRGRIRRPTTTPRTTTEPSTTTAATERWTSGLGGGFQANEVLQQPSVALPDYYDYLAAEPAQDAPTGVLADYRRPYTSSYEDDDPEAGGAESQWTNKWHQNPNSLPTEPSRADGLPPFGTKTVEVAEQTNDSFTDQEESVTTAPGVDDYDLYEGITTLLPYPASALSHTTPAPAELPTTASEPGPLRELAATIAPDAFPATPTPLEAAMALGQPSASTGSPGSTATGSGAPDRRQRRLRVRVRARVNLKDMLEPAESQHVATLANAIPSVAAKAPWPAPAIARDTPPSATEPLDASSTTAAPELLHDTSTAPPTDSLADPTPAQLSETLYTTPEPSTEPLPATTSSPSEDVSTVEPAPGGGLSFTGPGADVEATTFPPVAHGSILFGEDETEDDLTAVSARQEPPAEETPFITTTELPTTSSTTTVPTTDTPVAFVSAANGTVAPEMTPAEKLYDDIQRARAVTRDGPSDATARLLGTSTTTEVSHETEICYRGRCVKTKTRSDASAQTPTDSRMP